VLSAGYIVEPQPYWILRRAHGSSCREVRKSLRSGHSTLLLNEMQSETLTGSTRQKCARNRDCMLRRSQSGPDLLLQGTFRVRYRLGSQGDLARASRLSVQVAFHRLFLTVELPLLRAQTLRTTNFLARICTRGPPRVFMSKTGPPPEMIFRRANVLVSAALSAGKKSGRLKGQTGLHLPPFCLSDDLPAICMP
jgi:hypothetical protein